MPSHVTLRFIARHGWNNAVAFNVYHREGDALGESPEKLTGMPVSLWPHEWQRVGFGHGRLATGPFGWAQGESGEAGFGSGQFAAGEFGYHNPIVEWIGTRGFTDGLHTFGVRLVDAAGRSGPAITTRTVFIASTPPDPTGLTLLSTSAGTASFRWL